MATHLSDRPAEEPDREALALYLSTAIHDAMKLDVPLTSLVACRQIVDDLAALLPTPPTPGGGGTDLRGEDDLQGRYVAAVLLLANGDVAPPELAVITRYVSQVIQERDEAVAALAARDADQGAGA